MKKKVLFSAFLMVTMIACKDKDNEVKPQNELSTRQTALIGKNWMISSMYYAGMDLTSTLPACFKDDIMRFTGKDSGYVDENIIICDNTLPTIEKYSWKLFDNENKMEMSFSDGKDTYDIVSVSGAEMSLKLEESVFNFTCK